MTLNPIFLWEIQPRRISAISIARRVSLEMGDDVPGTSRSLVGYQIRLESRMAEENIVVFCTTVSMRFG